MATNYSIRQAFASVHLPLRMPCWNVLSIGNVGSVNSLDVHSRVILRKRINSQRTVPLRAILSKLHVNCTLSCRCRCVGSGLGFRFWFGLRNIIGNSLCSNRRIYTLHHSCLQGHILPSRGPRHPRPAPLVSQVVLSTYVNDWGEGFGVPFLAPRLRPFYFFHNSFHFSFCFPPSPPLP